MAMYRGYRVGTAGAVSALTRSASAVGVFAVGLTLSTSALAQSELEQEALAAQQAQAELQAKIDAADESVRERIEQLRQAEQTSRRLTTYNDALAPQVEELETTLAEREAGVSTLTETREALPGLLADMTERLGRWVEQDIPFLKEERLSRVAALESQLSSARLSNSEKLEHVLGAWRVELGYGRELDAWRGTLTETGSGTGTSSGTETSSGEVSDAEQAGATREVDYLRLGRVGWYYLTPDGQQGAVWKAAEQQWQPLSAEQRDEVAKGLSIVRDQRAPELLNLPLSQPRQAQSQVRSQVQSQAQSQSQVQTQQEAQSEESHS